MTRSSTARSGPGSGTRARALRFAVVGAGQRAYIAQHAVGRHVAGAGVDGDVVAIVDTTPAGRERGAAMFGADVAQYESHRALVDAVTGAASADERIDAAFVTTPDSTHADIAVDLLRAGIAVYLEKPLAITIAECDRVLAVAAETGTPLYVGHNFRRSAAVSLMHDIVARGEIGEVKAVWCRHFVGNGGDYYFKDWHADRRASNSLLLQKASHDIDVIHLLAGAFTTRVTAMGELAVYGGVSDRTDRSGQQMEDWFSFDNWPPLASTGLNPVVDVEDVSMMLMQLDNGVLASYQQCHFTPDYWRNYTVIGTEGRLENFGDTAGGVVRVWNRRHEYQAAGDVEYPIGGVASGHEDADALTVHDFVRQLLTDESNWPSLRAARAAVAAGALAAESLRSGSVPLDIPPLDLPQSDLASRAP